MTVDLRHDVTAGPEHGFQDIIGMPDLDTLVPIPWEPGTSWCIADLLRMDGTPVRGRLRAAPCAGRSPSSPTWACTP